MNTAQPLATIAQRIGITERTLRKHSTQQGFPRPTLRCGVCSTGLLYDADAVQIWEHTTPAERPRAARGPRKPALAWPLSHLAQEVGRTTETLRRHSHDPNFPAPVASCGTCRRSLVYDAAAVRRFEEGAPVDPSDRLVSLQEAADELHLSYGSMRTYLGRHEDFPKPFKHDGPRPLFSLRQIQAWQSKRQRHLTVAATASAGDALEVEGLLTRAGVAAELGIQADSVTRYMRRDTDFSKDFPESVRKIGRARLWDPEEIHAWRNSRPLASSRRPAENHA
ncbi:helix-turn-helix transcriptional regulator [Brachybacterium sp. AOP25-B2-12]|uniref:helix-turn-helix transcriptional regulator n=1 Tax=Brachybacterium sp. AOP25-B2-12 TaxID=3457710 RepID=UPI004034820F